MSIASAGVGPAASYARERINTSQSKRAISMIILSAPLLKMTIIYLQECIELVIDTHESMILKLEGLKIKKSRTPLAGIQ